MRGGAYREGPLSVSVAARARRNALRLPAWRDGAAVSARGPTWLPALVATIVTTWSQCMRAQTGRYGCGPTGGRARGEAAANPRAARRPAEAKQARCKPSPLRSPVPGEQHVEQPKALLHHGVLRHAAAHVTFQGSLNPLPCACACPQATPRTTQNLGCFCQQTPGLTHRSAPHGMANWFCCLTWRRSSSPPLTSCLYRRPSESHSVTCTCVCVCARKREVKGGTEARREIWRGARGTPAGLGYHGVCPPSPVHFIRSLPLAQGPPGAV